MDTSIFDPWFYFWKSLYFWMKPLTLILGGFLLFSWYRGFENGTEKFLKNIFLGQKLKKKIGQNFQHFFKIFFSKIFSKIFFQKFFFKNFFSKFFFKNIFQKYFSKIFFKNISQIFFSKIFSKKFFPKFFFSKIFSKIFFNFCFQINFFLFVRCETLQSIKTK